jgi:hypothetical protein
MAPLAIILVDKEMPWNLEKGVTNLLGQRSFEVLLHKLNK